MVLSLLTCFSLESCSCIRDMNRHHRDCSWVSQSHVLLPHRRHWMVKMSLLRCTNKETSADWSCCLFCPPVVRLVNRPNVRATFNSPSTETQVHTQECITWDPETSHLSLWLIYFFILMHHIAYLFYNCTLSYQLHTNQKSSCAAVIYSNLPECNRT